MSTSEGARSAGKFSQQISLTQAARTTLTAHCRYYPQRRAAELAALKAAQKANLQAIANGAITAQPSKASAATAASVLAGDNHAIINNNVPTDNPEVITEVMNETPKSLGSRTAASKKISSCMSEKPSASKIDRLRDAPLGLRLFFSAIPVFILYKVLIA